MSASDTSIGRSNPVRRAAGTAETDFMTWSGEATENENGSLNAEGIQSPLEPERFSFFSITKWYSELNKRNAATVLVLCYCNLINYMDRSTVAGMMDYIKKDEAFNQHSDKSMGLLQTAFVFMYMLTAPLFGILGDRMNRKLLVGFGLAFWSLSTLLGSFCENFWWFLFFRALVGVGEASYSTVAPAIISDLFVGDTRSKVLASFYFAIPVGTGLGYIIGSQVGGHAGDWRWGLRVTPFMGLVAVVLILLVMVDPPRGASEHMHLKPKSTLDDLKSLAGNRSFCLLTMAFTCVAFCVGALMWWGPIFAFDGAKAACGNKGGCEKIEQDDISYRFGIVMTLAGLAGVPIGSYVSQALRHKIPNADPLVCGWSLLMSVPVLYFGFVSARYDVSWCYGLTFLAGLLLNCNWAIVSDMTLYLVIPIRRSFASATQILVSHALGDAVSPYLIGAISDAVKNAIAGNSTAARNLAPAPVVSANEPSEDQGDFERLTVEANTPEWYDREFRGLQYALFLCCFFQTVGGFIFLVMSWYIEEDKKKAVEDARAYSGNSAESGPITNPEEDLDDESAPVVRNIFADEAEEGVVRGGKVTFRHEGTGN